MTVGRSHRWFRSYLTSNCLYDINKNVCEHPPENYQHIIQEQDWKAFVAKRLDPKFKVNSPTLVTSHSCHYSLNLLND